MTGTSCDTRYWFITRKERTKIMGIEQNAQNHAMQGAGMKVDPSWSDAEKEKYEGAYAAAKKKADEQRK